ncbi:protein DENND6B isoform X3 [Crotalus tigris]|uniref:protein DENND6B isoform X3 n=1 Tax=Crotalus tigris TaxID=88082 RepID=UPI00192F376C|nr:protein DENND6B isoform X3 [Crotalus tigris]
MASPVGRGFPPPALVPRGRLSAWLECVCAVTFDLELGQALERIYPPEGSLTEKERTSVCYLAFPDSYSGSLGDTQFSFRFRRSAGRRGAAEGERRCSREAPPGLQPEPAHLFGYVFFRQVRDRSVQRGYFQKSLVLVTRLPYVNLFHSLLHLIAPEYFEKLDPCLEAVCSEIDQWPPPVPGQTLNLPVMGVVIQVRIPSRGDKPGSCPPAKPLIRESLLPAPLVLPSVAELDLFRCFQSVLVHIQLLWELVLLGEPLVVVAPSPAVSSEVVLALVSCLAPLKYCCDFRPYFTIHDSEFKEYTTRTQGPPSVLLGVTNPFFIKMLQHWPHILRLGELWMAGDLPKQVKLKKLAKLKTLDTKPGLYTSYRTFLHKDKTLIKRLLKGIQKKRPSEAQSALLRRQLLELTQSFIIPLEHYMASLMPLQRTITPWKTPPRIRPFHQEDFLKSLEHTGPQLTCVLKGDWLGLYRRFFKSPNFKGWFRQRHREMRHKLEALHLEAIAEAALGSGRALLLGHPWAGREHEGAFLCCSSLRMSGPGWWTSPRQRRWTWC